MEMCYIGLFFNTVDMTPSASASLSESSSSLSSSLITVPLLGPDGLDAIRIDIEKVLQEYAVRWNDVLFTLYFDISLFSLLHPLSLPMTSCWLQKLKNERTDLSGRTTYRSEWIELRLI